MHHKFNGSKFLQLCLFTILFNISLLAHADWMNLTGAETSQNIAEIYILEDHIKVNLEVYVEDLDKFEELLPDDWLDESAGERPTLEQRMHDFASKRLQFITEIGVSLPAKLELVEARMRVDRVSAYAGMINPMTRQRIRQAPEDKRVLYAEIIYTFPTVGDAQNKDGQSKSVKPEQLKIIPPLDENGIVTTDIGFVVYHRAVPVIDFRFLGQPATLNLDWKDPWYSKFENKNLSRHHKYPLMLYMYVEPRQVRQESLLRVSDIAEMTGFNLNRQKLNTEDKFQQLQAHLKDYYTREGSLDIDGEIFHPDSVRVEYVTITLKGLKVVENVLAVDESSLLVGVSQQFLRKSLPQKIKAQWQFFNQRVDRIPVIVTDPAGPFMSFIEEDSPGFGWQNFLKKYSEPVITPVVVETGWVIDIPYFGKKKILDQMPEQSQALSIVDGVLENSRTAFIEKEPASLFRVLGEVLYDKVGSDNTENLQKELAKLFSPKVTGGAVGAVQSFKELKIVNIRQLGKSLSFSATVSGSATIIAKHWGHVDQRQVNFQLLLDLVEVDKQWRLTDLTVIDIKEVK
jgi:hypothetical protein